MHRILTAAAALTLVPMVLASPATAAVPAVSTGLPVHVQNDAASYYAIGIESVDTAFRCPLGKNFPNAWDAYSYECNLLPKGWNLYAKDMSGGISDFDIGPNASVKEWAWSGSTPTYIGCWNGPGYIFINYAQVTLRTSAFYC